jgi:hypothetical protein
MDRSGQKRSHNRSSDDCDVKKVLHKLIERSREPSRVLEAYYWTTEPDLAEFIRQFLALSDSARRTLMAFMSMTREAGESVEVTIGFEGKITLSSPAVSEAMKLRTMVSIPHEPPESLH